MSTAGAKNRFPEFQEKFKNERIKKKMNQAEFADFLGIARPTVGFYESGERIPDALILRQIATKCKVSSDWLLGLSPVESPDIEERAICEKTGLSRMAVSTLVFETKCKEWNSAHSDVPFLYYCSKVNFINQMMRCGSFGELSLRFSGLKEWKNDPSNTFFYIEEEPGANTSKKDWEKSDRFFDLKNSFEKDMGTEIKVLYGTELFKYEFLMLQKQLEELFKNMVGADVFSIEDEQREYLENIKTREQAGEPDGNS